MKKKIILGYFRIFIVVFIITYVNLLEWQDCEHNTGGAVEDRGEGVSILEGSKDVKLFLPSGCEQSNVEEPTGYVRKSDINLVNSDININVQNQNNNFEENVISIINSIIGGIIATMFMKKTISNKKTKSSVYRDRHDKSEEKSQY